MRFQSLRRKARRLLPAAVVATPVIVWVGLWFRGSYLVWAGPTLGAIPLPTGGLSLATLFQLPFTVLAIAGVLAAYAFPSVALFGTTKSLVYYGVYGTVPRGPTMRTMFTYDRSRIDDLGLLGLALTAVTGGLVGWFGLPLVSFPLLYSVEILLVLGLLVSGGVEVAVLVRVSRLLSRLGPAGSGASPRGVDRVLVPVALGVALLRTPVSTAGTLPEGGSAAVSGVVDPREGLVRSPGGADCVVCRYRVEVVDPARRSDEVVLEGVDAVPFAVEDGDGGVVVDPAPWDPGEGLVPDRSGRPPADYRTSSIRWSDAETFTARVADPPEPLLEYVGDLSLSPDDRLEVTEHRVDPGEDVFVLGRRVDSREVVADVANVAAPRRPFWLSPGSRWEAIRASPVPALAVLSGLLVVVLAVGAVVALA